jgi:hypothetical protein
MGSSVIDGASWPALLGVGFVGDSHTFSALNLMGLRAD